MFKRILAAIDLMRPKQWVKNLFVFAPIFFAGELMDGGLLAATAVAFAAFCCASSSIYALNDSIDYESDRKHPKKCRRPVAAGLVSPAAAKAISVVLMCAALAISFFFLPGWGVAAIIVGFLVLNLAYCFRLKRVAILDIFSIVVGFLLRLLAGSAATGIHLSQWIVVMTFMICLLLAIGKRRDDLRIGADRKSLSGYSFQFIDIWIGSLSACIMLAYFLYAFSAEGTENFSEYFYLTGFLVVAALMRYSQKTIIRGESGSPTELLFHDHFIQLILAAWVAAFFFFLYII